MTRELLPNRRAAKACDRDELWESPAAMALTAGDLRAARAAAAARVVANCENARGED